MLSKDDDEHAIPVALRGRFVSLVASFAAGDFTASHEGVVPVSVEVASLIARNLRAYGDVLVPLNAETWGSSVYCWMDGYWQVMVDLSTEGEPISDLALHAVVGDEPGLPITVEGIWVP